MKSQTIPVTPQPESPQDRRFMPGLSITVAQVSKIPCPPRDGARPRRNTIAEVLGANNLVQMFPAFLPTPVVVVISCSFLLFLAAPLLVVV